MDPSLLWSTWTEIIMVCHELVILVIVVETMTITIWPSYMWLLCICHTLPGWSGYDCNVCGHRDHGHCGCGHHDRAITVIYIVAIVYVDVIIIVIYIMITAFLVVDIVNISVADGNIIAMDVLSMVIISATFLPITIVTL